MFRSQYVGGFGPNGLHPQENLNKSVWCKARKPSWKWLQSRIPGEMQSAFFWAILGGRPKPDRAVATFAEPVPTWAEESYYSLHEVGVLKTERRTGSEMIR